MHDTVSKHNYYTKTARMRLIKDLRPYKPEAYYEVKDHKDIYYQGKYHKALYKGNELLWRRFTIAYHYGFFRGDYSGVYRIDSFVQLFSGGESHQVYQNYNPEILCNISTRKCDTVGVFCVIENCPLDDISVTHDNFEAVWGITKSDYGSFFVGPDHLTDMYFTEPFAFARVMQQKECKIIPNTTDYSNAKVQFYFYMSKKNTYTNKHETMYLAKLTPSNTAPEIWFNIFGAEMNPVGWETYTILDNGDIDFLGYKQTEFRPYVEIIKSDNTPEDYKYDMPFITDFNFSTNVYCRGETSFTPYCNHEKYLPHDILTYLLKDTEFFNDKEDAK